MSRKALLIVDVQNDFCPGGSLAVTDGDKVVEPLNRMIEFAVKNGWDVFASRDWHPAHTRHFKTWPVHCVQGTKGARFHPDLMLPLDYAKFQLISKGAGDEDGYSAFEGINLNYEQFENILRNAGVEELYVGGLATDYCVKASVMGALLRGFVVNLLWDACMAVNINNGDGDKALREMCEAGAFLMTTKEVCDA